MIRRNSISSIILMIAGVCGLAALMFWGNYQFASNIPGGEHFLTDWFSARSLLIDGVNPYSITAQENLLDFATQTANVELEDETRFDLPLYATFFSLPFALVSEFPLARALWLTVVEAIVAGLILISLSLARWKARPVLLGLLVVFSVFWFHGMYPLISGSMSLVVALIISGVFLAVRARQFEFAGVLLGFASIQPHAMLLFAVFVLVWSIRYRHAKVAVWFFATIILLSATAALIRPQWIMDYVRAIIQPSGTVFSISQILKSLLPAAGQRLGLILSGLVGLVLFIEWFISKKADFASFYWTGLVTLTLTPWVGLPTEPVVFIVSFPAIFYACSLWLDRWPRAGIILSSVALILLSVGIWLIFFGGVGLPVSDNTGLYFAQPLIVTIMLYWVRWWAIRKPNVWFDQMQ